MHQVERSASRRAAMEQADLMVGARASCLALTGGSYKATEWICCVRGRQSALRQAQHSAQGTHRALT